MTKAVEVGASIDRSAEFLENAAEPVRDLLAAAVSLPEFLATTGELTLAERKVLVDQALVLIEQNYVHLPLKVAMHAVNPVQRLRVMRARLERQTEATAEPTLTFHAELAAVFHSLRDLHTNYLLPATFARKVAFLPFLIEDFTDDDGVVHYVISRLVEGFPAPAGFGPGAEVTHWSGIPISRAIDINAARFAGSNEAARRSRGLHTLTLRSLLSHLPPDEEWVTISYIGTDGTPRELLEKWRVVENAPTFTPDPSVIAEAEAVGVDIDTEEVSRARKLLYAPDVVALRRSDTGDGRSHEPATEGADLPTAFPVVFRAHSVTTPSGVFGHLRIFTFGAKVKPSQFFEEFLRLIRLLPQNGLIIDVRGNGGGYLASAELALQTLTPRPITPAPTQFIVTPLNVTLCRRHKDSLRMPLGRWVPSMEQAVETGATFSAGFPLTPESDANAVGQQYFGPVVLVTDARCYSATDFFAAGFQDHAIGPVLGVDANTGAGGANVYEHKDLLEFMPQSDPESPYVPLPQGAGMRVALRRGLRVGALSGTLLEDLGVQPDQLHHLTRDDVLRGNVDLLARAGKLLAGRPVRSLSVSATRAGADLKVELRATNVDRADLYLDGRPRTSVDMAQAPVAVTIPGGAGARTMRVEGFAGGVLVAARRATLAPA